MEWDALIGWKKDIRFIVKKEKVLIANTNNGASLFISKECFDIFQMAINEKLSFETLLNNIFDLESREYMKRMIDKLNSLRVWNYEGEHIDSTYYDISLDITNCCNLRCKHCCISAGENIKGADLSEEQMMDVVDKVTNLNPKVLTISGGEPLVRKDFKRIINRIRNRYNGLLILMTNATLIDDEMAKYITEKFNVVDVSIDGADEESCAILRGTGTFGKCINGIEALINAGMKKITASMVETKQNAYAKKDFIELCMRLNISPIVRALDDSGRAENMFSESVIERTIEDSSVNNETNGGIKGILLPQVMSCQGAKLEFQIDYRGNIYPCGAMMQDEYYLGNVLEQNNLKKYLEEKEFEKTEGYKHFDALKPYNLEKCCECEYNVLCFNCVNEIRKNIKNGSLYHDCIGNKRYFDLYWGNDESV